jgi:hypothetical protein
VQLPGSGATLFIFYIFLIVRYRRTSGSDLTATSPSAAALAAAVIVVMYPIARIIFLSLICGSATAARDANVADPGAGSKLSLPPPGSLPACGRRSYLSAFLGNGGR